MLDLAIVIVFLVYGLVAGLVARRRASRSLVEYFLAGRRLPGWQAGTSMSATQYAADTPLLVAGLIAVGGIWSVWRLWIYGIAFLVMGFLLGRAWRRAGVLTDAEFTEIRYSGAGVLPLRVLKALYYGTFINCVVMAFVLVAATRLFEVFLPWHVWLPSGLYSTVQGWVAAVGLDLSSGATGLPFEVATTNSAISIVAMLAFVAMYSTTGGLRSVVSTDIGQFGLMMAGTLLYAIFAVRAAGGLEVLPASLAERYGEARAAQTLSFLPPLDEALMPFLIVLALQWFFQANSDGTGYLAQRTMACRSDRDARAAAVVFTLSQIVLRSLLWLPIVIALLVIYPPEPGVALGSQELDQALIAEREMLFLRGIDELLPAGVRGLMLTAMLAALASTLDTHLNWGASYWSNDLYKAVWVERVRRRTAGDRELVWVARFSNLLVLAVALVIVAHLGSIQQGWRISLLFGAGIGSVLVLRWLWERINMYCELAAMAVSILLAPALLVLVKEDWLRLAIMSAVSSAVVVATAWLAPATDPQTLQAFYRRVRPPGMWRATAAAAGADPAEPGRALRHGALSILLVAVTTYGLLVGLGTWIARPAERLNALSWTLVGCAAVPFWWRRL